MREFRRLTMLVMILLFIVPPLISIEPATTTNSDLTKIYTESYEYHDQIWIQSNEEFSIQATAEGWDGDGSEEDPYIITGYLFDCETQPLRIWHTTVHWVFIDNVIDGVGDNVQCGTWLQNVSNGAIVNNEIFNRHTAIAIEVASDFIVSGNHIHDCWGSGIEFIGGMNRTIIEDNTLENIGFNGIYSTPSRDSVVRNNNISGCNWLGIGLIGEAPNCNVTGNTISNCSGSGLMMDDVTASYIEGNSITDVVEHGVFLKTPINCVVSENTVSDVIGHGIRFEDGITNEILENVVENCSNVGIILSSDSDSVVSWNLISDSFGYAVDLGPDSASVSVKFNTFIGNGVTCQVCDNGISNVVSQNYYDDWSSPDANADGYVDSPYLLDGDAENQDDFPLAVAGVVPTDMPQGTPLSSELILIAGGLGVIVIVALILLLKRK